MNTQPKKERLSVDVRKMQFNGEGGGGRNTLNLLILLGFYFLISLVIGGVVIYALNSGEISVLGAGIVGSGGRVAYKMVAKWIRGKDP
ncbi:hypothetical protein FHW36_11814 [Chitinophaga polysaccharea]|uniref:Uncharacterized protein n=2 Tax=Chitinophaga polysaccharea TaxID=1293035 RepID=A0A561P0X4_9BACT|nr:hypothetical protein FHW36_11814 [Chitinophaga polysaccharea]